MAAGRPALLAAWLALALFGLGAMARSSIGALAQSPPTVTPTATPAQRATLPMLEGRWSVTRSWYRRCPACAMPVVRTTTWQVTVVSDSLRVAGGPSGRLIADGAGRVWVSLEGLERMADSTLRFVYGTLRVSADGRAMEGGFNGSERLANPCGSSPPVVTCFANGGWLRAVRVAGTPAVPGSPTPTGPPHSTTPAPTATATDAPTGVLPVTATPSPTSTSGRAATPTATASRTPTTVASATVAPRPDPRRVWLPLLSPGPR